MHLNFCDPALRPCFSCDKPSHDGYAVSNLASNSYSERQQGFLAYSSPPVTVTIDFLCSASIKHIIIWPQVLSQMSLGLEISVRCAERKKQTWQSCGSSSSQQPAKTYVGQDDNYYRVGSIILESKDKGVVFTKQDSSVEIGNEFEIPADFSQKVLFRHSALTNADSLKIKIFKTTSSTPALKKVEVWGQPGSMCSRQLVRDVFKSWHTSSHYQLRNPREKSLSPEISEATIESKLMHDAEFPEEYLDSITCDVMTLPFILPSGKMVDLRTLEKHKEFEAKYGRAPSDPFTGKLFTHNYQPVPNHDLKRRINLFLSENSHRKDLQHVPRTTGTKAENILENNIHEHKASQISLNKAIEPNYSVTSGVRLKRRTGTDVNEEGKTKRLKASSGDSLTIGKSSIFGPGVDLKLNWIQSKNISTSASRDEAFLDARLDMALKDALHGCPSYVNFVDDSTRKVIEVKPNSCGNCKRLDILYRLPCNHLICRLCLVSKKDKLVCTQCNKPYESCDASRYHNP